MTERLQGLHARHGRKVSLVGWSLGGIYARELARHFPELVRQVITLASPFRDTTATTVSPAASPHRARPTTDAEDLRVGSLATARDPLGRAVRRVGCRYAYRIGTFLAPLAVEESSADSL